MFKKFLKAILPPIIIIVIKKLRDGSPSNLFDGDDVLFKEQIQKVDTYGEYGCGESTKWVLKNTLARVIAVDTSQEWVEAVIKENQDNTVRLSIHCANLGEVGAWGRPIGYEKIDNFSEYTDYIWSHSIKPKLVLVDGRFRVCCFLTSLKFADEGTSIIFDDYTNRTHYHFVEKYVSRVTEYGRQCLFKVPPKATIDMHELNKDIELFRNVMD